MPKGHIVNFVPNSFSFPKKNSWNRHTNAHVSSFDRRFLDGKSNAHRVLT